MISAFAVWGTGRSGESEVPFEEVRFQGSSVQGRIWVSRELGGFFEDAFDSGGLSIECWEECWEWWEGHGESGCLRVNEDESFDLNYRNE